MIYLQVPFAEKDEAKKLGARWHVGNRCWFVMTIEEREACYRWPEVPEPAKSPAELSRIRRQVEEYNAHVKPIRGERFFEHSCNCLPWEPCPECLVIVGERWGHD